MKAYWFLIEGPIDQAEFLSTMERVYRRGDEVYAELVVEAESLEAAKASPAFQRYGGIPAACSEHESGFRLPEGDWLEEMAAAYGCRKIWVMP